MTEPNEWVRTLAEKLTPIGPGVCAAGGQHEDASAGTFIFSKVTMNGDELSIDARLCAKCSCLYWTVPRTNVTHQDKPGGLLLGDNVFEASLRARTT